MHAALGLAVLVKGPVGFLVPLLVMALCLGLADVWLDLRHRSAADASAGPTP